MSLRKYISTKEADYFETNKLEISSSIPIKGDYNVGDMVISNIQKNNVIGWVCVEKGNPGKWKPFGNVEDVIIDLEEICDEIAAIKIINTDIDKRVVLIEENMINNDLYIASISEEINAIKNDLNNCKKYAINLELQVNDNKEKITQLTEQVNNNSTEINSIKEIVGNGIDVEGLDELKEIVVNNSTEINSIKEIVDKGLDELKEQVDNNSTEINSIKGIVVNNSTEINSIKEIVDKGLDVEGLDELKEQVNINSTEISGIKEILDKGLDVEGFDELKEQVNNNSTEISDIKEQVNNNSTEISDIKEQVVNNSTEISGIKEQVNTNSTEINSIKGIVVNNSTEINSIKEIVDKGLDVEGLDELKEQVNINSNNIGDMSSLKTTDKDNLVDAINEVFQSVSNGKTILAEALTDRGLISSATESFSSFREKIDSFVENTLNIIVAFDNDDVGCIKGNLILKRRVEGKFNSQYKIYWADNEQNILQYDPICEMDLSIADYCLFDIKTFLSIPYDARKIVAYNINTQTIDSVYTIPESKLLLKEPNYSFGLLADIHIKVTDDQSNSSQKLEKALRFFIETENVNFVTIAGDIITSGLEEEMVEYQRIRNMFADTNIYCSRGNHDTYYPCTVENFIKYIEPNGTCFERKINDDVYIFFGMVMEDQAYMFSHLDLDWLEERLEEHINERVFLIQHVFVEPVGNANGTYPFSVGMINTEETPARRFRNIVAKYRNVIHIAGHSHHDFSMERFSEFANCNARNDEICHRIHVPSGARPRVVKGDLKDGLSNDYEGSQGYVVDVFDECVVFRGYDFALNKFDPIAHYCINTIPLNLKNENSDIVDNSEYPFVTDFQIVLGSLGSSGDDKESNSSFRTDFIPCNNDNPNKILILPGKLGYVRICYYDENKNFLRLGLVGVHDSDYNVPNDNYADMEDYWSESGKLTPSSGYIVNDITDDVAFIKIKAQGNDGYHVGMIEFNGIDNASGVLEYQKEADKIIYPKESKIFKPELDVIDENYDNMTEAKIKALNFIKKQHNPLNYSFVSYVHYNEIRPFAVGYTPWLENASIINNKIIKLDKIYDVEYKGLISGIWFDNLDNPEDYRVDVYVITDQRYFVESCELMKNRTWTTTREAAAGIKHIEVVHKESGMVIEYGLPLVDNYTGAFINHTDADYLITDGLKIFFNGELFMFYGDKNDVRISNPELSLVCAIYDQNNVQVSRGGCYDSGRANTMIASYLLFENDPLYNSMGVPGTERSNGLMKSRSFIYDLGLALLVYTLDGEYDICKRIITRLSFEQNDDGSFDFSMDLYSGKLSEPYIRTGAMGWLIWGICYYCKKTGDMQFNNMLSAAGEWILSRQVLDENDIRYGLLTGGYGTYTGVEYIYSPDEIVWCSTEHNCSASQALYGLYHVLGDEKYLNALNLVLDALNTKLYDDENGRFYQGIQSSGVDDAWALDCLSWAGKTISCIGEHEKSIACADNIIEKFLVTDKSILVSDDNEYYNTVYSLPEGVTVDGFCPYADGYNDPPQLVWTEGTLGVISLYKKINRRDTADKYIGEMIKLQNCINSTGGIIYTTETRASLPYEFHAWECVVSSAWLYLVLSEEDTLFNLNLFDDDFKIKFLDYTTDKLISTCKPTFVNTDTALHKGGEQWYYNTQANSLELYTYGHIDEVDGGIHNFTIFYYFNEELKNILAREDVIELVFNIENVSERSGELTVYAHNALVHSNDNNENNILGEICTINHNATNDIKVVLSKDQLITFEGIAGIAIRLNSVSDENTARKNNYSTKCNVDIKHDYSNIDLAKYLPTFDSEIEPIINVNPDNKKVELFVKRLEDVPYNFDMSNVPIKSINNIHENIIFDNNIIFGNKDTITNIDLSLNKIVFNTNVNELFADYTVLTEIKGIENVIFNEGTTSLSGMFKNCKSLVTLDLSNWDVKGITDLSYLLQNCESLETIEIKNWKLNELVDVSGIFENCNKLKTINMLSSDVYTINRIIDELPDNTNNSIKPILFVNELYSDINYTLAKNLNWEIEPYNYYFTVRK